MDNKKILINLKSIRENAGLSLSQTSELTGVSKAMLHQIEKGDSSPTIATLWKLAKGFRLPLTAFLEDLVQTETTFTPAPSETISFPDGLTIHTIFPFDPRFGSETFCLVLEPGQTHLSNAHVCGVVEDVFVIRGEMEVLFDGEWTAYKTGDGLRFNADQPHGYRNQSSQPVQFHNVMHYSKLAGISS